MKVQGFFLAAGACKKKPQPRAANLEIGNLLAQVRDSPGATAAVARLLQRAQEIYPSVQYELLQLLPAQQSLLAAGLLALARAAASAATTTHTRQVCSLRATAMEVRSRRGTV